MATTMVCYGDRIVINPEIMAGKPVVKGTRIPVELVLKRLSQDLNIVATARVLQYPLVTVDARILAYPHVPLIQT